MNSAKRNLHDVIICFYNQYYAITIISAASMMWSKFKLRTNSVYTNDERKF